MIADEVRKWTVRGLLFLAISVYIVWCTAWDVDDKWARFWALSVLLFGAVARSLDHFRDARMFLAWVLSFTAHSVIGTWIVNGSLRFSRGTIESVVFVEVMAWCLVLFILEAIFHRVD